MLLLLLLLASAQGQFEVTAGAFWRELPEIITYDSTIPLFYTTSSEWIEDTFTDGFHGD